MIKSIFERNADIIIKKNGKEVAHIRGEEFSGAVDKEEFKDIIIIENNYRPQIILEV